MSKKTLILIVGLPRSGKSTAARNLGCPIVSPDAIRLELHGRRFHPEAEAFVWALAQLQVGALFRAGHDRVALDACNHTRRRRDEWKSDRWQRAYVHKYASKDECIKVARSEKDEEIIPVIEKMAAEFEPIQGDEWETAT